MQSNTDDSSIGLDLEGKAQNIDSDALVASGGKLPHSFQVSTTKLLDVIIALNPRSKDLDAKQRKKARQSINQKLYIQTRPGSYLEVNKSLHLAYMGQPNGAKSQHHWRIFCSDSLKKQIEILIAGTALTVSETKTEASGNYSREWGGLYLRSEAEVRIAEALDRSGILFFANARGRVGLQETTISDSQLTGRVEVDFLVFHQGKCISLEVDGQHHLDEGQIIRDYARDRVLLRAGVPTVRFTARDCLERPHDVVSEVFSILLYKC